VDPSVPADVPGQRHSARRPADRGRNPGQPLRSIHILARPIRTIGAAVPPQTAAEVQENAQSPGDELLLADALAGQGNFGASPAGAAMSGAEALELARGSGTEVAKRG